MATRLDPQKAAKIADLHYVLDSEPGIQRKRHGKGFSYLDVDGKVIRDPKKRARFESLAIPPAWTEVWICPDPDGHIQATGRDEKGRKQYIYHPRWLEVSATHKFDRMAAFGEALPKIREVTDSHLRQSEISREKVLAVVVRLLELTLIRIGNREYARQNKSYGLTTMRDKHVTVEGKTIHFEFKGKSGVKHAIDLQDKRLAKAVKACQEIPGQILFQYYDEEGSPRPIGSADVNAYLREITGEDFTAKDFRTWGASALAVALFCDLPICEKDVEQKKQITSAVKEVAHQLGNTAAVCRNYYIHPAVVEAYQTGKLGAILEKQQEPESPYGLQPYEAALLEIIQK